MSVEMFNENLLRSAYAVQNGFNVIPNVAGHGIGRHFHDHPIIFHSGMV
jgi:methionine aminopeptidase